MAAGTVTYVWPVAGATAPTAAQAAAVNSVVADIVFAAADTVATVTHNLALSNGTGADGYPDVSLTLMAAGSAACTPFFAVSSANAITVDKNSTAANTGITVRVTIRRPHSIVH